MALIVRLAISFGAMAAISILAGAWFRDSETIPAFLLLAVFLVPAPLLYLGVLSYYPQRNWLKHFAYHSYWLVVGAFFGTMAVLSFGSDNSEARMAAEINLVVAAAVALYGMVGYLALLASSKVRF